MTDRLVKLTGYAKGSRTVPEKELEAGFADWTRMRQIPTFTIELYPYIGEIPYPDKKFNNAWDRVKDTGLFFMSESLRFKLFIMDRLFFLMIGSYF